MARFSELVTMAARPRRDLHVDRLEPPWARKRPQTQLGELPLGERERLSACPEAWRSRSPPAPGVRRCPGCSSQPRRTWPQTRRA